MSEWQPIEKDSVEPYRDCLVYWPKGKSGRPEAGVAVAWREADGDWTLAYCGDFAASSNLDGEPTHWMPLPEPPLTQEL
jgi:hypothetical protein